MSAMWIVIIATAILGPIFTLLWWKQADRWADAEHKRFKPKVDPDAGATRVVIRRPPPTPPAA